MLYFIRNGVYFKIPIAKDAVYDHDILEKQIRCALIDLQNLKDRSPGLDQIRHETPGQYIVSSLFGKDEITIIPPIVTGGAKKRKEIIRRQIQRVILGLEYTDQNNQGPYVPGYWPNWHGNGVLLGTIGDGKFNPELDIRWSETAPLLGPWHSANWGTDPDGDNYGDKHFYANCQGEKVNYFTPDVKIEQLEEATYDAALSLRFVHDSVRNWNQQTINEYIGDVHHFNWIDTTDDTWWIKLNGVTIVGPVTSRTVRTREFWHNTSVTNPSCIGSDTWEFTGANILDVGGLVVDESTYLCLYSKQVFQPGAGMFSSGTCTGPRLTLPPPVPVGTHEVEAHALCSGRDYLVGEKTYPAGSDFDPHYSRCARIFKVGRSDTDQDNLIYVYSFTNPVGINDDGDYTETPTCLYGYAWGDEFGQTDVDYEMVLFGGASDDVNIVPGMPDGFFSSILMRACLETKTVTEEFEYPEG